MKSGASAYPPLAEGLASDEDTHSSLRIEESLKHAGIFNKEQPRP
jgi:hypothetical protein